MIPKTICTITIHSDENGRIVEVHQPVPPKGEFLPTERPMFIAAITGQANTPMGPINLPLKIRLPADNIHDAYAVLKETVDRDAPGIMQQQVEQLQARARRASLGNLGGIGG
jgi:hypothetical protein